VISEEMGVKLENVTIEQIGTAERVVVDKDTTTIITGAGDPSAIQGRCNELRRQIDETDSDWDREKLQERLARLAGGVAVIRVGAATESEPKRRKDAFDDAISSTKAAVAEGIVPGGGAALARSIAAVQAEEANCDGDERTGVRILAHALQVPARQIADNAGADDGVVIERILAGTGFEGFDARNRTFVDLDVAGIIDPTKVVRTALENAVSVAGVMLLAAATMVELKDTDTPTEPEHDLM
jgi:chaperonin GroEL